MKKKNTRLKIKKPSKDKTFLVIDADIFAYQCCTEYLEEVEVRDEEWSYVFDLKTAKVAMRDRLEELARNLNAYGFMLCFGSIENWRRRVMPEYKANRKDKRKPLGYGALVKWMSDEFDSFTVPGLEADDVVGILATDKDYERNKIVVSEDKDLQSIPGLYYNPRLPEEAPRLISEKEADYFHYTQTLTGDPTDGYKGCPGVGAVGAKKLLEGCEKDTDIWPAIVAAFEKASLTEKDALCNARVARILRVDEVDDDFKPILWKPKKGK